MYVGQASLVKSAQHTDNVTADKSAVLRDKVNSVCEAVKSAVQTVDEDRWLWPDM